MQLGGKKKQEKKKTWKVRYNKKKKKSYNAFTIERKLMSFFLWILFLTFSKHFFPDFSRDFFPPSCPLSLCKREMQCKSDKKFKGMENYFMVKEEGKEREKERKREREREREREKKKREKRARPW